MASRRLQWVRSHTPSSVSVKVFTVSGVVVGTSVGCAVGAGPSVGAVVGDGPVVGAVVGGGGSEVGSSLSLPSSLVSPPSSGGDVGCAGIVVAIAVGAVVGTIDGSGTMVIVGWIGVPTVGTSVATGVGCSVPVPVAPAVGATNVAPDPGVDSACPGETELSSSSDPSPGLFDPSDEEPGVRVSTDAPDSPVVPPDEPAINVGVNVARGVTTMKR